MRNFFQRSGPIAPEQESDLSQRNLITPEKASEKLFRLIKTWNGAEDLLIPKIGELIGLGADINYRHLEYADVDCLKILNSEELSVAQMAVRRGFQKVVRGLLQEGVLHKWLLVEAINCGNAEMITVLARERVNFRAADYYQAPLIQALEMCSAWSSRKYNLGALSKALIAGGASTNPAGPPFVLDSSIKWTNDSSLTKLLIERGGPVVATKALALVVEKYQKDLGIIEVALAKGANIEFRNQESHTPLRSLVHSYEDNNNASAIELLLAKGASIAAQDDSGVNVLRAAYIRDSKCFRHVVSAVTVFQVDQPENFRILQDELRSNQNYRNYLGPRNKKVLSLCLPDGPLQRAISATLPRATKEEESFKKFLSIRDGLEKEFSYKENPKDFTAESEVSPMAKSLARAELAGLMLNRPNLRKMVDLNTIVAGSDKTKGHDSILMQAFEQKVGKPMPPLVAESVTSFLVHNPIALNVVVKALNVPPVPGRK